MVRPFSSSRLLTTALVSVGALSVLRCTDFTPVAPSRPHFARAKPGAPTVGVTAVNPTYGHRGQTGEQVTITGSGFVPGAVVSWQLHGVDDPHVIVRSATVVSSTEIDAVIDIASDAEFAMYDVTVLNADRSKGIGSELFEITTATSIGTLEGTTIGLAANDIEAGSRVTGISYVGKVRHAFVWSSPVGPMIDLGAGYANAIDAAGLTVAGEDATAAGAFAVIWTASAGGWSAPTRLPVSLNATGGTAMAIASSTSNGLATIIAGSELVPGAKRTTLERPVLWRATSNVWVESVLRLPDVYTKFSAKAYAVNALGEAVGVITTSSGSQAVYWDSNGNPIILPGSATGARILNAGGTLAAGSHNGVAAYWKTVVDPITGQRSWTGPFDLTGGCDKVMGVDAADDLVARRCSGTNGRYAGVVFMAPDYSSSVQLGGLGNSSDAGEADAISPHGLMVGSAPTSANGTSVGAIWRFLVVP